MVSFHSKAIVCGVLALGLATGAHANLARNYDVLHDGRIEDSLLGKSRSRRQLEDLIAKNLKPDKKKIELALTGEDFQKYYDAAKELSDFAEHGKRKGESDEDFAKRAEPVIEAASAGAKVILEAVVETLGNYGADQISVQASPETIEFFFLKKVDKKMQLLGKVVIALEVKDGDVKAYNLKAYTVKKKDD